MRYHDGPFEAVAGGPFVSGEMTTAPDDWTFLLNRETIQFQTLTPAVSRTIWMVVHDGRLFLSSGSMNTAITSRLKRWPYAIESDDRVIVRFDGKLYAQRFQRINDGPDIESVLDEFDRK